MTAAAHTRPQGLSPRVWGNPLNPQDSNSSARSIPTGMGKPFTVYSASGHSEVYPHGYGETAWSWAEKQAIDGLSPRVWGNHYLYVV